MMQNEKKYFFFLFPVVSTRFSTDTNPDFGVLGREFIVRESGGPLTLIQQNCRLHTGHSISPSLDWGSCVVSEGDSQA